MDDKALTDWNALAARGLVRAGRLLEEPGWVDAAAAICERLHDAHVVAETDGSARLRHTSSLVEGGREPRIDAFLEDLACLALADLELFGATGDDRWYDRALGLATDAHARFHDPDEGGWFQTPSGADDLYTRPKDTWDNATPAGTSVMVEVCLQLAGLSGDLTWRDRAEEGIRLLALGAEGSPTGYGWLLRQLEAIASGPREVAIVGDPGPARDALVREATRVPRPGVVVVVADETHGDHVPLLAHRRGVDGQPAAYVCRDLTCDRPVTTAGELAALLDA